MSTLCVNINGTAFNNLVSEYNIHPSELELTIFKWMNDNNKEWSPENENELRKYIEETYSFSGTVVAANDNVFKNLSKLYEQVNNLNNLDYDDAVNVYNDAIKIAGKENVSLYMNNSGSWNIRMKMPISKKNYNTQYITVAPYFRQKLNSTNKKELEKATEKAKENTNKLAEIVGLKIKSVQTLGGTYLGSSEISYLYETDSTDQEKVDLLASLMGDLSFEYQDSVIAANFVNKEQFDRLPDDNKAYEVVLSAPTNVTIENIEKQLNDFGIDGSSYKYSDNKLTIIITAMNWEENRLKTKDELRNELNNIKNLNNYGYKYETTSRQNSRYFDNRLRQSIYRSRIKQLGGQNRELYNACSKALAICEAAARFPEENQEQERIKAAQEAAKKWDTYVLSSEEDLLFEATEEDLAAQIEHDYAIMLEANPVLKQRFGDKKVILLGEILNNAVNDNSPWTPLIKKMLPKLGELLNIDVKLDIDYSTDRELAAFYEADTNTITVYGNYKNIDQNLIHEVLHAVIYNNMNKEEYKKDFDKLFNDIKNRLLEKHGVKSIDEIEDDTERRLLYGVSNADEFVSEYYSNPTFRKEVLSLDETSEKESVLTRIANFVKKILRIDTKGRITKLLKKVVSSYDGTIAFERKALSANKKTNSTFPSRNITKADAKKVLYEHYLGEISPEIDATTFKKVMHQYKSFKKDYRNGRSTYTQSIEDVENSLKSTYPDLTFEYKDGRVDAVKPSAVNPEYIERKQWIDNLSEDSLISEAQRLQVEEADVVFNKANYGDQLELFSEETKAINNENEILDSGKENMDEALPPINSEKETKPVVNRTVSPLKQQFDNLKSKGSEFPLSERISLAKTIVNYVSETLTDIQTRGYEAVMDMYNNPNLMFVGSDKVFVNFAPNEKVDYKGMKRNKLIETIGLPNLLRYVREAYMNPGVIFGDENLKSNIKLVYDNWQAMLLLANKDMVLCEGYTIDSRIDTLRFNPETGDLVSDLETDMQEIGESEAWSIRAKSVSARNSMSVAVRRIIRTTKMYDENGEEMVDKYGFSKYCNPDELTNVLLSRLHGCATLSQMRKVLEKGKEVFKEFNGILQSLKTNKEFSNLFFSNFSKDEEKFYVVAKRYNEATKRYEYQVLPLNQGSLETEVINTLTEKSYTGDIPVWKAVKQTNEKGEAVFKFTEESLKATKKNLEQLAFYIKKLPNDPNAESAVEEGTISNLFALIGIDSLFSKEAMRDIEKSNKVCNTLKSYFNRIYNTLSKYSDSIGNSLETSTNIIANNEKEAGNIHRPLRNIAETLGDYVVRTIEPVAYQNGKSYYAYSNPSLMGIIKRKIKDPDQRQAYLNSEFKISRFFYNKDEKKKWLNHWLDELENNSNAQQLFDHQALLTFEDNDYSDMGTAAFETCSILNYFASSDYAWYKVPIPADKTAFEFVKFLKLEYRDSADNKFIDTFKRNVIQEMYRINTVLRRSLNNSVAAIEKYDISKSTFKDTENFDALTLDKYISATRNENEKERNAFNTSGAVFHFFPFLNEELTKKTEFGKTLFAKIKGVELDAATELAFMDELGVKIYQWMKVVEEAELENYRKHGLLDIETKGKNYNNRFLSKLHSTKDDIENSQFGKKVLKNIPIGATFNKLKGVDLTTDAVLEIVKNGWISESNINAAITNSDTPEEAVETLRTWIKAADSPIEWTVDGDLKVRDEFIKSHMTLEVENALREYTWGNYYGRLNLIEITVTDPANFGNVVNLQKRYAMVHSPGVRPNIEAEINGVRVTDGYARTMTLKDAKIISSIRNDVVNIFQSRANNATSDAEKEFYLNCVATVKKAFGEANQTDAQAYTCPTAMRKKLAMFGKWDDSKEAVYQKIKNNDASFEEIQEVLEVLKPFVGGTAIVPSNVEGAGSIPQIRTAIQNKNSEYMLLLADALAEADGKTTVLGELYRFMESTHYNESTYLNDGIDIFQFESSFKVGDREIIDVSKIDGVTVNPETNEITDVKKGSIQKYLSNVAFKHDENGNRLVDSVNGKVIYNDNTVVKYSYEYYSLQQDVPNHMTDHMQLDGSQKRILVVADQNMNGVLHLDGEAINTKDAIDEYFNLVADNIYEDEKALLSELLLDEDAFVAHINKYVTAINDSDKTDEEKNNIFANNINSHFKKLPENLRSEIINLYKNTKHVSKDFLHISQADRNYVLSSIIQESIQNDANLTSDMFIGCTVDSDGKFIIPLSDPIQSAKIQQLLFAMVKGRINKQKVKGGPAVQVSSFGTSKKLNVVFNEENGEKTGVKHMECYITCPKHLEKKLTMKDKNGKYIGMMSIEDALAKNIINENDLKVIGYRIPTEDTYSIIPLRVVGFLPRFAGDTIMLPVEHLVVTGSDFDIDKFYLQFRENSKQYNSKRLNYKKTKEAFIEYLKSTPQYKDAPLRVLKEIVNGTNPNDTRTPFKTVINDIIKGTVSYSGKKGNVEFENNWALEIYDWFSENIQNNPDYWYNTRINKDNRSDRNNRIFDLQYALLQTAESKEKMMNPGNFDILETISEDIVTQKGTSAQKHNILTQETDSYFYGQNMAAKKLIGSMANATTSHVFCSLQDIQVTFPTPFKVNFADENIKENKSDRPSDEKNTEVVSKLKLDPVRNRKGKLVSKVLGSNIGAAADAAKKPVFKNLNITPSTAKVAMLLERTGFSEKFTAYFLAQPVLVDVVEEYERRNSYEKVSIDRIVKDYITDKYITDKSKTVDEFIKEKLNSYVFSAMDFRDHLKDYGIAGETLALFNMLLSPANDLNELTFVTKFNSMTNAAGPTIAETMDMQRRVHRFIDNTGCMSDNAINVIKNNPILKAFYATTIGVADDAVTEQKEDGAVQQIFAQHFMHYSPAFQAILDVYDTYSKTKADADTIEALCKFFVLFEATKTHISNGTNIPPVLDGSTETRKKLSSGKFIRKIIEAKKNNPDNTFLNAYTIKTKDDRCPVDTINTDINGGSSDFYDLLSADWSDLLNNDGTKDIAKELFHYSVFRNGFRYSPKTPLHTAGVDIKLAIDNYTLLNELLVHLNTTEADQLVSQFKRNNWWNTDIVPEVFDSKNTKYNIIKNKDNSISIAAPKVEYLDRFLASQTDETPGWNMVSLIKFGDDLYEFDSCDATPNGESLILNYNKTTSLGIKYNFIEVDGSNPRENISTVFNGNYTEDSTGKEPNVSTTNSNELKSTTSDTGTPTNLDTGETFTDEKYGTPINKSYKIDPKAEEEMNKSCKPEK